MNGINSLTACFHLGSQYLNVSNRGFGCKVIATSLAVLLVPVVFAETLNIPKLIGPATGLEVPKVLESIETQPIEGFKLEAAFPKTKWWETTFNDAILNGYIEKALENNPSLNQAQARVLEARAAARAALGQELPQIDLIGTGNQRWVINGNSFGFGSGGGFAIFSPNVNSTTFNIPLSINYDLDIWRKKRDRTKAQYHLASAQQQLEKQAQNILVADLASDYFNLAAINTFIGLQEKQYALSNKDVELTQLRFDEGVSDEGELARKKQINFEIEKALRDSQLIANTLKRKVAMLMGEMPEDLNTITTADFAVADYEKKLFVGDAEGIINQRKDIQAALQALEAAKIDTRVAKKAYLPTFNILGAPGYNNLLVGGIRLENLAANLTGTILQSLFTGGQRKASIKAAKARQEQALNEYFKTTISAFQEINDALNAIQTHQKTLGLQTQSDEQVEKQNQVAEFQLQEGLISPLEQLPILNNKVVSKQALLQLKRDFFLDIISLNRSLGGGF